MLKKKFLLGFIGFFSLLNASLHAMESEIESKEIEISSSPTCKRKDYTDAITDLFAGDQVNYKEGYLSIYDSDTQTLSFKFLGDEAAFTHIGLPRDTSKVYPVNNKDYFLYKSGPKKKRTLYFYDKRDPEHPSITLLATRKYKRHHLGLVSLTPSVVLSNTKDLIYFFQAESFKKEGKITKKEKPCSSEDKRAFSSHTKIFSFDPATNVVNRIVVFPFFSEKVLVNGESDFILFQGINGQDVKFIRASSAHSLYLTLPFLLETGSWGFEAMDPFALEFSKNAVTFLSSEGNKKGMRSPFYYDLNEGIRRPVLSTPERESLVADVSTLIIHPLTEKLIVYGEDGLRRIWKTPETHEKEYGKLARLLNKLQAESESNFSFMGIASSGKEMVFKEINLNGNFRFLVINSDEYKKEEETTISFSPKWIDFSRNEDFYDLDTLVSLPQAMKDVAVLTETYQSREGADIPVYIVRPVGAVGVTSGIVSLHGGPKSRTIWAGEDLNEARYLATKGYTTIFPQFRGGTGFGIKHLQEGYRKHTTTVINDVIDAAQWAEKKGYIKGDQTVVMGESYGAYLTSLILTQRLKEFPFKGGWAYSGFYDVERDIKKSTDLALIQTDIGWGSWRDFEDRKEMKDSSPLNHVKNLTVPFVMLHGEEDNNCHYEQAENMSKALKKAGKPHSLIKIKNQGHEQLSENQPLYLAVVEKFLHETLGGPYEPLTPEKKKNKNVKIVRDTTGFFNNFKK